MSSKRAAALTVARQLLLVLLLTMPVWAPLTRPGLPASKVGPIPVIKLYAVEQGRTPALAEDPNPWQSEGPWAYLVARLARIAGADGAVAVKWSLLAAMLVLALALYGWVSRMAGPRAGVLAAVLALFAPLLLSAIYQSLDMAVLWVLAGLAVAGFGATWPGRWDLLWAGIGVLMAGLAAPGLGLLAGLGALAWALLLRRWRVALAVTLGMGIGILVARPWSGAGSSNLPGTGLSLSQLIEPGWLATVRSLDLTTPASYSLGFALLALLLVAGWAFFQHAHTDASLSSPPDSLTPANAWLYPVLIGLVYLILSLDVVVQRLPFLSGLTADPRQTALLALPFLAVAAASALRFLPDLRKRPLWAALLIIAMLGAGPALSSAFQPYDIATASPAVFGDNKVMLLNHQIDGELQPGETITLAVDWLAITQPDFDYNIFLHVIDENGAIVAQLDTQPQAGAAPMTTWVPGQIIPDAYQLSIPADAPGTLRLLIGLYNWQTQERLPVGASDALQLIP